MEIGIWLTEEDERSLLEQWACQRGHRVLVLRTAANIHECLNQRQIQVMIASDELCSFDEIQRWRTHVPEVDWLLVTRTPSFAWAEAAMLAGAVGFCVFPIAEQHLDRIIDLVRMQRYYRLQVTLGIEANKERIDFSRPIESALVYIGEHLSEHLTLRSVSREVYLSPSHFSRLFAQKVGIPFNEYLLARRIDVAKTLLTETRLPIELIAARVGVYSASHFSQTFKRLTGTNPRTYRNTSTEHPL